MAHAVRLLPQHRLGLIRLSGNVTGRDVIAAAETLLTDPRWRPGFDVAWDLRPLHWLDLQAEEVERLETLAVRLRGALVGGRTAVVVWQHVWRRLDVLAAPLLRSLRKRVVPRGGRVFWHAAAAEEWLGAPAWLLDEPWEEPT